MRSRSLAVASLWAATGVSIPDPAQPYVEVAAGLLLIWLGVDLLREREGGRARVRPHEHSDGTVHVAPALARARALRSDARRSTTRTPRTRCGAR